jgi:hypothetical protein
MKDQLSFWFFGVANTDFILCDYNKTTFPSFYIFISKETLDSPYEGFSSGSAKTYRLTASWRIWFGSLAPAHK